MWRNNADEEQKMKQVQLTYLFNGDTTRLRDQEVYEEDSNKLPKSKEDVDTPLQGAQHVQKGCTHTHTHTKCQYSASAQNVLCISTYAQGEAKTDHNKKLGTQPGTPTI